MKAQEIFRLKQAFGAGIVEIVNQHEGPYRFISPQQLMADFMADLKEHCHD